MANVILKSGVLDTLALLITLMIMIFLCLRYVKSGKDVHIRKIMGLEGIDEAVGRATEMGRPVHFTTGTMATLYSDEAPQILAGLSVLSHVARLTARNHVPLIVTVSQPSSLPLTEEIIRQSYMKEGRSEDFSHDMVRYISTEQQAYAAGVLGIFFREKVAANFMIGPIYAESLILAEAGFRVGAMQVGGSGTKTGSVPFLIAVCDYVLIGEEMYAAGAYLSREPTMLANLLAEDLAKFGILALVIVGALVTFFGTAFVTLLKM
ncbi:MAG: DUF6754 domain-containing protein [Candidatus Bathyarchaeia archaeon]